MMFKRCPQSGKIVGYHFDTFWAKVLFPIVVILAIAWFLVRVIPKPDRMTYPCQKFAMGLGGSFLAYVLSLAVSLKILKALRNNHLRVACLSVIAFIISSTLIVYGISPNPPDYKPILTNIEGANNPMGEGRGIFPGRVVWVRDTNATSWDGKNGFWWDDNNTDQQSTDGLFKLALTKTTGTNSQSAAWQKLFEYHNSRNGKKQGYQAGEKFIIKVNLNPVANPTDKWTDRGYSSPHMVNALVKDLIEVVGVKGQDIIIADPSRHFVGPLYHKIRSNPSAEYKQVQFVGKKTLDLPQQVEARPDIANAIYFNMPDGAKYKMCLPQCFTDANYIIDFAVVRPHRCFGTTNVAKNHFGSVWSYEQKSFAPNKLHAFALWDYPTPNKHKDPHSNPVLLGHKTIYSKTLLYLADGLYTAYNQHSGNVQRMSTMNNDWLSSLFMSLDPVALESVCYDVICSEPNLTLNNPSFNGHQDSQLHEAALAHKPPSGTVYDPENNGKGLPSLGVHEHWNNAEEKLYSRNMGKEQGIELVFEEF
ncbi:DUF362 domain-containing protein [Planctomycetota bacterium]